MEFFVTVGKALEPALAQEIRDLGVAQVTEERGGVRIVGGLKDAYRVCLLSRLATRVLYPVARFKARDPEALYTAVRRMDWMRYMDVSSTLAVDFTSTASAISHTQFGAQRVKDAIVDLFRERTGERPSVDRERPDLRINVYLNRDEAIVSLDLSGESLHQRGYRQEATRAPLKENLAAALLRFAEWEKVSREGGVLLDPMCGSGTIPIEAAWMSLRQSPQSLRARFGLEGWKEHRPEVWREVYDAVRAEEAPVLTPTQARRTVRVIGWDREPRVVRSAIGNAEAAGLGARAGSALERGVSVHFERRDFFESDAPDTKGRTGVLVFNPPYGERLGEAEELVPFYRRIGDTLKQRYRGWSAYVLVGNLELAKEVGLQAARRYVLYNGPIEARCLKFELY